MIYNSEEYPQIDIIKKHIIEILSTHKGITFDELREELERHGIYVDALIVRKILAEMIRSGEVEKVVDEKRRRLVFILKH